MIDYLSFDIGCTNKKKLIPHRVIVFRCNSCNENVPRSQVLEQVCHDENLDHYFISVCPKCGGEVDEIEIDERDLS